MSKRKLIERMSNLISSTRGISTATSTKTDNSILVTYEGEAFKVTLEKVGNVEIEEVYISSDLATEIMELTTKTLK